MCTRDLFLLNTIRNKALVNNYANEKRQDTIIHVFFNPRHWIQGMVK